MSKKSDRTLIHTANVKITETFEGLETFLTDYGEDLYKRYVAGETINVLPAIMWLDAMEGLLNMDAGELRVPGQRE